MSLVTHHTTKLRMMKTPRRIILAASMLTLTASSIAVTGGSALAARGPCYNRGGYSFQHETSVGETFSNSKITVWSVSGCKGLPIVAGYTMYDSRDRKVTLTAQDYKCDNTGITLYTHGPSVASIGCGQSVPATFNASKFGKPYHFWVRVGGTTNSNAANIPIR